MASDHLQYRETGNHLLPDWGWCHKLAALVPPPGIYNPLNPGYVLIYELLILLVITA